MLICRYFLCFALFSFIGWAYESVYYTIQQRKIVNSGFLNTCFCPIYGIGALLNLMFLGWIENPWVLFFTGMILTGVLEYFVSWLLEKMFHQRWWDYTNWPLNINGRICIFGAIAFGIMTVLLIKCIAPFTFGLLDMMSPIAVVVAAVLIAIVMLADTIITVRYMDTSKLWYVDKQSEIFEHISDSRCVNAVKKIKENFKR